MTIQKVGVATTLWSELIVGLAFTLPSHLRMLVFFPANRTTLLLPTYVLTLIIAYTALMTAVSLVNSMMADVVDEFELQTGNRPEGLFFSKYQLIIRLKFQGGYFFDSFL